MTSASEGILFAGDHTTRRLYVRLVSNLMGISPFDEAESEALHGQELQGSLSILGFYDCINLMELGTYTGQETNQAFRVKYLALRDLTSSWVTWLL